MLTTTRILRVAAISVPARMATLHTARVLPARIRADAMLGFSEGGQPPTDKQVRYAQELSQRTGMPLPQEALSDKGSCSRFIEDALSKSPPSARQIELAERLATDEGIALPDEARLSQKACSDFINQRLPPAGAYSGMGAASGRQPSEKQLLYAASLARERQLGLTYEQLSDRASLSSFIDQMLQSPAAAGAMAAGVGSFAGQMGGDDVLTPGEVGGEDVRADATRGDDSLFEGEDDLFADDKGKDGDSLYSEGQIPF